MILDVLNEHSDTPNEKIADRIYGTIFPLKVEIVVKGGIADISYCPDEVEVSIDDRD